MTALSPFSLIELATPAIFIIVAGTVFTWLATRSVLLSLFLPFIKVTAFLLYYGIVFDGTWTFLDDWKYIENGQTLLVQGVSVTNFWAYLPELFSAAGGPHFIYYLYNADAFRLFGTAYYSPVAVNIVLTFLAAAFMAAAARRGLGFSRPLAAGLFAFMALHPDVIAWSTIMNGKDILVLTGTALVVYAVSLVGDGRYMLAVALSFAVGLVLFFTRFYVPLMLLLALFATLFLSPAGRRRPGLWLLVPAGLASIVAVLGGDGLANAFGRLQEDFVNPLYGVPRMALTPIPFHTTENYAFLNLPQVFHWAMLPALAYGVVRVWRRATLTARFVVVYFLLTICLYGIYDELQGPRHRVQLDGLIALFQFYGGVGILAQSLGRRPGRAVRRTNATRPSAKGA